MGAFKVGNKSICLPVSSVTTYETLLSNPTAFRRYLELWVAKHPEIFPPATEAGFWFHDFVTSRKLKLRMRRIQLIETGEWEKQNQLSSRWLMTFLMPIGLAIPSTAPRNYQERLLYNMQYFHCTKDSARLQLRVMSLI